MHWFWRATIAVVAGWLTGVLHLAGASVSVNSPRPDFADAFLVMLNVSFYLLPMLLVSVTVFWMLTKYFGPIPLDSETRCRKCGYILRGIREPICSECGERI